MKSFVLYAALISGASAYAVDLPHQYHTGTGAFNVSRGSVGSNSNIWPSVISPSFSEVELTYFMRVNGPDAGRVPIDLKLKMQSENYLRDGGPTVWKRETFATAAQDFSIKNLSGNTAFAVHGHYTANAVDGLITQKNQWVTEHEFTLQPGSIYKVTAHVSTEAHGDKDRGIFAYAQWFFSIDSEFLRANPAYTLEFSDGIYNSPRNLIPEPASSALFVVGLGALVFGRKKLQALG